MADKKTKYKLIRGKHNGFDEEGNRKTYVAGDWLLLTDDQAKAFKGKVKSEAQVKLDSQMEELDKKIHGDGTSREQPLAPLEPTKEDSNELADENAQESLDKQTQVPTTEPSTTQAKPAAPAPAAPVKPAK